MTDSLNLNPEKNWAQSKSIEKVTLYDRRTIYWPPRLLHFMLIQLYGQNSFDDTI